MSAIERFRKLGLKTGRSIAMKNDYFQRTGVVAAGIGIKISSLLTILS